MTTLKPQTALGAFAFVTLLLAVTAVGRILGMGFGEALYLAGLLLVVLGWLGNRLLLRCTISSEDREA